MDFGLSIRQQAGEATVFQPNSSFCSGMPSGMASYRESRLPCRLAAGAAQML